MTFQRVMNYSHQYQSESDDDSCVDLWAVVEGTARPKTCHNVEQRSVVHANDQQRLQEHIQDPKSRISRTQSPYKSPPESRKLEKSMRSSQNRKARQARHQREWKNLRQQKHLEMHGGISNADRCAKSEVKSSVPLQESKGRRRSMSTSPTSSPKPDHRRGLSQASRGRRHSISTSPTLSPQPNHHGVRSQASKGRSYSRSTSPTTLPKPNHWKGRRQPLLSSSKDCRSSERRTSPNLEHHRSGKKSSMECYRSGGQPFISTSEPRKCVTRTSPRIGEQPLISTSEHQRIYQASRSRVGRRHSLDFC